MVKSYGYKFPIFVFNKTIIYCSVNLTKKRIGIRNYTRGYLYDFKNFLNNKASVTYENSKNIRNLQRVIKKANE